MLVTVAHLAFVAVAADGPCDILGRAGNPCVAAHSTVRALYSKYAGPVETPSFHPRIVPRDTAGLLLPA